MPKLKLFLVSLAGTACVLLAFAYVNHLRHPPVPRLKPVGGGVLVTSQLRAENLEALRRRGVTNIVDLRPDGEDGDQAPSSEIKQAAELSGMAFHYIPVPHGDIPGDAVDALHAAISDPAAKTVLYCRSGNRAVRTFALVEASRPDGPDAEEIVRMVHVTGFSANDLKDQINSRIARRNAVEEVKK